MLRWCRQFEAIRDSLGKSNLWDRASGGRRDETPCGSSPSWISRCCARLKQATQAPVRDASVAALAAEQTGVSILETPQGTRGT